MNKKILLIFGMLVLGLFMINNVSAVLANTTLFNDTFEGTLALWTTDWTLDTAQAVSPTHSVHASATTNDLVSNGVNTLGATKIYVSFKYRINKIDENDDVSVYYWDGTAYDLIDEIGDDAEATWLTFSQTITDAQYLFNNFRIYIEGSSIDAGEDLWIDDFSIVKENENNNVPVITNITASHSIIKGGNTITIWANTTSHGVNDTENDTLYLYCDSSETPTSINTDCTGGTLSDTERPYILTCTFATAQTSTSYTEFCRIYDGTGYSVTVPNITYTTDTTAPTTSVTSVAGDTSASYYDAVDDGRTDILVSGEASMACRWSDTDIVYGSMTNICVITGTSANCSVTGIASQGFTTRYVSCQDNYTNSQTTAQNLDVSFYLDYTAPTTSDNSNTNIQAPTYIVTITEQDNVDSDPTSYYCTSTSQGCNPTTIIDNGGTITYTTSNRGANYLRYYSIDDAGNSQTIVNKTININRLPIFTSASDNAVIIKGGTTVNVSTVSSEPDSQQLTLYVCNSASATFEGCTGTEYCTATGSANLSCTFTSETDSASHTWYAYIFDDSDEAASNNPRTGSYTTDTTAPSITINSPGNTTITQSSVTFTITVNEALTNAWYSLDNGVNNVSMINTSVFVYTHSNTSIANSGYQVLFWANDSYDNIATENISFTIDTTSGDTTAPTITIVSPNNNTYYTVASTLLNLTTDEALSWAGYTLNGGVLTALGNISTTNWNATITLTEQRNNITFYANDSSSNKNQATKTIFIYTDLTNPSVDGFSCTDVNDSEDVVCSANISDIIGLSYAIIGYNATGSWQNSSQISLSGISDTLSYTIASGNHSPLGFTAQIYLYDDSGRGNLSESDAVVISDDTFPEIYNITYIPNTTALLDPGTAVDINVSIVEDFNISSVVLMYKNLSVGTWTSVTMTNNSALTYLGSSTVNYNASFTPQNDTWYFQINATDSAGNSNISSEYTLVVENDTSANITTTIPAIKSITYTQRAVNNSLGYLDMNNSGDGSLGFNITLTSSYADIQSRLSVNYTNNQSHNYSAISSGQSINITIDINTTSLDAGLYDYNITIISEAGTEVLEKQLNIQTAAGAFLSTTITTYSSSVTPGDTSVEYVATVTNLGTSDATGVYLNWTLPSGFSLASGSLSRSLGNLAVGVSGTNTITIDVSSSASDGSVNITADATASNADSSSDTNSVTIGSPAVVVVVTPGAPGGGSGGGGAGGGGAIVYYKIIEIVRGGKQSFDIEVENIYSNATLENLVLELTGYPSQYITITPKMIGKIDPKSSKNFTIEIEIPVYEGYEENDLKAIINGLKILNGQSSNYQEKQNIKLIIQEIDISEVNASLIEAEKAIKEMQARGFCSANAERLLEEAKIKISERDNKGAKEIIDKVIATKEQAFRIDSLIQRIIAALEDPKKIRLLVGDVTRDFDSEYSYAEIKNNFKKDSNWLKEKEGYAKITGKAILDEDPINELLNLAIVAFDRCDYDLAEQRIDSAQTAVLLSAKGNFGLFILLYWPFILFGISFTSLFGIVGYRKYRKSKVTKDIEDLNKKEENIRELMKKAQLAYFTKKMSSTDYNSTISQYNKNLATLRNKRIILRNKRIKLLKPDEVFSDLQSEVMEIESEIKKLQTEYYLDKKISEKEYTSQFEILNQRLAENEGERATIQLLDKTKQVKGGKISGKSINNKLKYEIREKTKEKKNIIRFEKFRAGVVGGWRNIKDKFMNIFKKKDKKIKVVKLSELRKRKVNENIKNVKYKLGDGVDLLSEKLKGARKKGSRLSHHAFMELKKSIRKDGKKGEIDPESFVHEIKEKINEVECKNKWLKILFGGSNEN